MKNHLILLIGLLFTTIVLSAQNKTAQEFQEQLNEFYANQETSPLPKEKLEKFKGLPFFPVNNDFRVVAQIQKTPDAKVFRMKTTTDRKPKYKVYAIASFQLKDKGYQLNIYKSYGPTKPEYKDYLFLPFTDVTNGSDTYGGGRFIDLRIPEGDEITIDFNQAYNPYCAYNHAYSCPIPPKENDLTVRIEAGVKYLEND